MKKFTIKTLGCKTNQLESSIIEEKLVKNGFIYTNSIEEADYFILNSCSVTSNTDDKALSLIKSVKNQKPEIKIVLTGCFVQLDGEELKNNKNINYLVGNANKFDIPEIINGENRYKIDDIFSEKNFHYEKLNFTKKTRATIKIQDGCNNRCSYCTIPLARGLNRSNKAENIIEQINTFHENGFKEIVLTGIHIGQWGKDFLPAKNIIDLLKMIESTDIHRYRLGSLDPLELDDEVINFLSESKKFCPHFHISLQSFCNKTLKAMNRNYSEDYIFDRISTIHSKFSLPFIGSDIIVGFPDETEEDFLITKNNLEKLELSQIHVFPYSKRKNTKAYSMENQVDEKIKKERVKIIQSISNKKHFEFLKKNIGTINEIIIEQNPDKKTKFLKGVTRNYINVLLTPDKIAPKNSVQKIKITAFFEDNRKLIAKVNNN